MAISVSPVTYEVTIPQADLTLIEGTLYELNVNTLRLWVKAWEDNADGGMYLEKTNTHYGEYTVAGETYSRAVIWLLPYNFTFEDGQYSVRLEGANTNLFDIEAGILNQNQVQVIPGNSAGLITSAETQYASFDGGVSIDQTNGESGSQYPMGTKSDPVDNWSDAKLIASTRAFDTFLISNNTSVGATDDLTGYNIKGTYHDRIAVTVTTGATMTNTQLNNVAVQGDFSDNFTVLENCSLRDIDNLDANVYDSELGGTVKLNLGSSRHWIRCTTNKLSSSQPVLDFQSTSQSLVITGYTGSIKLINFTAGTLQIYGDSVSVEVDSSCTGGSITVIGTGKLTDSSGVGCTVDEGGLAIGSGMTVSQYIALNS